MGRPTTYSLELVAKICELLASGLSLKAICLRDEMPVMSSVFLWLSKHNDFSEMYARAREQQAECLFEEILNIADECAPGTKTVTKETDKGTFIETVEGDMVERSKLRVDTRKWALARLLPKRFGDRIAQDIDLTTRDASLSEEQKANKIKAIIDRAKKTRKAKSDDIADLI